MALHSGQTFDYLQYHLHSRSEYWSGNVGLTVIVTLFGGFQIINNIAKSKYDFLKSQSDLEKSKNDISTATGPWPICRYFFQKNLLMLQKASWK